MSSPRDQFKSSYGAYASQQRELERARARRDARDAHEAGTAPPLAPGGAPPGAPAATPAPTDAA